MIGDELRGRLLRTAGCLRNDGLRLDEVPSAVRPATEMGQTARFGDAAIDLVAIGHQHGPRFDSRIQIPGMVATASRGIAEQADRRPAAGGLRPEVTLRLRFLPRLLEHLNGRLVAMDQVSIEQMIAQQVDDRLYRFANPDDARRQGIARQVAAEATQERGLPVQRQRIHVLRGHHPGQGRFGEQSLGDDACRCRRDLDALVAARAGIFDPLMLDDPYLLRNDVQLLADLDTDLDQGGAVMGADPLGLGQFMADDLARQVGIERLAAALLARVRGNLDFRRRFFGDRRSRRCQGSRLR